MKPFDLERFKAGDVAITRNGLDAYYVAYDKKIPNPLVVRVTGHLVALSYSDDGNFAEKETTIDLVGMKPIKKKGWIGIKIIPCCAGRTAYTTDVYISEEIVKAVMVSNDYIVREIEWEE